MSAKLDPVVPRVDAWLCVHDNELRERGFVKLPILALTQTRAERWCRVHERAVRVIELRPGDLLIPAEAREAADRNQPYAGLPPFVYHALMHAIEMTIQDVDAQRKLPQEAQCIDYAGILERATTAALAALPPRAGEVGT